MPKGIENSKSGKKKAKLSLKEKRQRKVEKRAAKQHRTVNPESLSHE
ncbi:MAG: hypothetical protein KDK62_01855 [Chlamydiia bacterium]|nr:hypothetical protein [Chlamydiia bacterium]